MQAGREVGVEDGLHDAGEEDRVLVDRTGEVGGERADRLRLSQRLPGVTRTSRASSGRDRPQPVRGQVVKGIAGTGLAGWTELGQEGVQVSFSSAYVIDEEPVR